MARVIVLCLNGLNLEFLEEWSNELPHLLKLRQDGIWGKIASTIPPTAAAACACDQTGRNPGFFGFCDYRYRNEFCYSEPELAKSTSIKGRRLYRLLPNMAQKVAIVSVPLTWPVPAIPGGYAISDPVAPDAEGSWTYPEALQSEIDGLVGDYKANIVGAEAKVGGVDEDKAVERIKEMDVQRFRLSQYFAQEKKCDYVCATITGADEMSRLFRRCFNDERVASGSRSVHLDALKEYYKFIDERVGEARASLPHHTALIVYADYSSQRLDGDIGLNEWLVQQGYLTLADYPSEPTAFCKCKIDWSKTKLWSAGSAGKIYVNLKGREAQGTVGANDYDGLINELMGRLATLPGEGGKKLNTRVFRRDEIHFGPYAQFEPDVFVCFDGYRWNTSERIGHGKGKLYSHDAGSESNGTAHGLYTYFCMAGPDVPANGEITGASLLDIAPTVLDLMGLEIPWEMEGASVLATTEQRVGPQYYGKRGEALKSRLESLGY